MDEQNNNSLVPYIQEPVHVSAELVRNKVLSAGYRPARGHVVLCLKEPPPLTGSSLSPWDWGKDDDEKVRLPEKDKYDSEEDYKQDLEDVRKILKECPIYLNRLFYVEDVIPPEGQKKLSIARVGGDVSYTTERCRGRGPAEPWVFIRRGEALEAFLLSQFNLFFAQVTENAMDLYRGQVDMMLQDIDRKTEKLGDFEEHTAPLLAPPAGHAVLQLLATDSPPPSCESNIVKGTSGPQAVKDELMRRREFLLRVRRETSSMRRVIAGRRGLLQEVLDERRLLVEKASLPIHEKLEHLQNILYNVDLYTGRHMEVKRLLRGGNASSEELVVRNKLLYMDVELKVSSDPKRFDFAKINSFDDWLAAGHFEELLPEPLCVCAVRVKNQADVEYVSPDSSPWADLYNAEMNKHNKQIYILVRNGENLYRIRTELELPEGLTFNIQIPNRDDFDWSSQYNEALEKAEEQYKNQERLFFVLQSMADKGVFNPLQIQDAFLRYYKTGVQPPFLRLVDDAGLHRKQLGAGLPSFEEWLRRGMKWTRVGHRIVPLTCLTDGERRRYDAPTLGVIYTAKEVGKTADRAGILEWAYRAKFTFKPGDGRRAVSAWTDLYINLQAPYFSFERLEEYAADRQTRTQNLELMGPIRLLMQSEQYTELKRLAGGLREALHRIPCSTEELQAARYHVDGVARTPRKKRVVETYGKAVQMVQNVEKGVLQLGTRFRKETDFLALTKAPHEAYVVLKTPSGGIVEEMAFRPAQDGVTMEKIAVRRTTLQCIQGEIVESVTPVENLRALWNANLHALEWGMTERQQILEEIFRKIPQRDIWVVIQMDNTCWICTGLAKAGFWERNAAVARGCASLVGFTLKVTRTASNTEAPLSFRWGGTTTRDFAPCHEFSPWGWCGKDAGNYNSAIFVDEILPAPVQIHDLEFFDPKEYPDACFHAGVLSGIEELRKRALFWNDRHPAWKSLPGVLLMSGRAHIMRDIVPLKGDKWGQSDKPAPSSLGRLVEECAAGRDLLPPNLREKFNALLDDNSQFAFAVQAVYGKFKDQKLFWSRVQKMLLKRHDIQRIHELYRQYLQKNGLKWRSEIRRLEKEAASMAKPLVARDRPELHDHEYVRSLREIRTRGDVIFPKGTIFLVSSGKIGKTMHLKDRRGKWVMGKFDREVEACVPERKFY